MIIKFEFTGRGYLSSDTIVVTNSGGEYVSNNVGGNWLYLDNFRIGNADDNWDRVQQLETIESEDYRVFDLFGREYFDKSTLKTGVYIQNKRLFFINNTL